ncbi:MAG: metallophosphatase family protein [Dehalococcoidales bacterium]|jgi:putative phosphoesterase|nr:metallophosphatase family protein [Dehalococcoidales bacterium]
MKIGVLSDTHADSFAQLPDKILATLTEVDLIIHAGDFVAKDVLEGLKQLGEIKAVRGNMDSDEIKRILPEKELLEIEGKKIGIIHGWGSPHGIDERVGNVFSGVDIIIYGHSHYPQNETKNGVFFFNPGQARNSFGILTIGAEVSGKIINL